MVENSKGEEGHPFIGSSSEPQPSDCLNLPPLLNKDAVRRNTTTNLKCLIAINSAELKKES